MKQYIFTGIFVFLCVLFVTFPARVAFNWFAPADMHLSGISGSVWNGSAIEGLVAGAYFQDLSWRLKPGSIFSGQIAFETSSKPAAGTLNADVAVSLNGSMTLSRVTGNIPLDLVHPAFQQNGISGDISLNFDKVVVRGGMPVEVTGNVTVRNFFVPQMSSSRLGDYKADFQSVDDIVTASVDDVSGVLDVTATMTLAPDRSYQILGEVAARADAPPSITQQLQILGSPDERGFRSFRFEGSL